MSHQHAAPYKSTCSPLHLQRVLRLQQGAHDGLKLYGGRHVDRSVCSSAVRYDRRIGQPVNGQRRRLRPRPQAAGKFWRPEHVI